ncbi:MAG: family 10 glycosylhydrolase [Caldithrix sp.]|nr:family 10 glycosylhydrolase [Caldithrix sp.]
MKKNIFFTVVFILFLQSSGMAKQSGLWVVRYALVNPSQRNAIIEKAIQLGVTDLYIQVWALGRSWVQTGHDNRPDEPALTGKMLVEFIEEAQHQGLKVHAWINVFYVWSGSNPPEYKNHVFNRYQSEILRTDTGAELNAYNVLKKDGVTGYFINPQSSAYIRQIKKYVKDLLIKFDFDGIHFDYFRYPGRQYSRAQHVSSNPIVGYFVDDKKIYQSYQPFIQQFGMDTFLHIDNYYSTYLREIVNNAFRELSQSIRTHNASTVISAAVKPDIYQARHKYFQDWSLWIQENWCDHVLMMNYTLDTKQFRNRLNSAKQYVPADKITVGVSVYNQPPLQALRKIKLIRASDFKGYSIFSLNYLQEHAEYFKAMRQHLNGKNRSYLSEYINNGAAR